MLPREIFTEVVDKETGEVTMVSNFKNGLLYGLFAVTSNKTVRKNEKSYRVWKNRKKNVPSEKIEHTNRGWFIDGYQVDEKSVENWFMLTENNRYENPKSNKKWNSKKKYKK